MPRIPLPDVDRLLGSACVLCGTRRAVRHGLCPACPDALPRLTGPLCRCGLPSAAPGAPERPCGSCLREPPPWRTLEAPLRYDWPLDRLVAAWKYRGATWLERPLLHIWLQHLPPDPEPDLVVPVPLHWRRRLRRGFNQATVLATGLGRARGIPVGHVLARRRATPPQQGLSAAWRRHNLRGVFHCRAPVRGRHVVLVDDVVTTGGTVREATRCLLAAGAASVRVRALARALPPAEAAPAGTGDTG